MIAQYPEVDLGQPIDCLYYPSIVGHPLPGVRQFAFGQQDRLCAVPIAVRKVLIGAMEYGLVFIVTTTTRITAPVHMLP